MSMSQDTTTITNATPPLMAVCASISSVTTTVMMAPLGSTGSFSSARCGSSTTADAAKDVTEPVTVAQDLP